MEQEKYSLIDIQYVKDFKEPRALMRIWRDELGYHTSTEEFGEGDKSFAAYFLNRTKVPRIPCLVVSGSAYYDPSDDTGYGVYRLIDFPEGNLIFESDPISGCDRSIASFIGIIAALDYQEQSGDRRRVYCDDLGAMHWLNRGEVETECKMNPDDEAYYLLQKGVDYLHENITFEHHIAFWITRQFGQNPANYEECTENAFLHMQRTFPMNEEKEERYRREFKYYKDMEDVLMLFGTPKKGGQIK